jgi:hypothetical protein
MYLFLQEIGKGRGPDFALPFPSPLPHRLHQQQARTIEGPKADALFEAARS